MKKAKRSGKGGSYFQATADAKRVLVSGTDQEVSEKPTKTTPEAKKSAKAQSTQELDK